MEVKDSLNDEITSQQKWFKWYKRIPLMVAILTFIGFFCYGIIAAVTHNLLFNVNNGFLIWLIWMLFGIASAGIDYVILKVLLSQKILSVLYLQILKERGNMEKIPADTCDSATADVCNILDETDDFETKVNKLKELYKIGEIDKEDYKKRLTILREKYNKDVTETADAPTKQSEDEDLETKLSKLKELHDSGTISDEEYRNMLSDFLGL